VVCERVPGAAAMAGVRGLTASRQRELVCVLLAASCLPPGAVGGSCAALNSCSNRGVCDTVNSKCICFNGFGSPTDVALYKAPDCSARTCPSDRAWVDVPTGATSAHALAECSNMGLCDTVLGRCKCFAGYEGEACQRCESAAAPRGAPRGAAASRRLTHPPAPPPAQRRARARPARAAGTASA